MEQLQKFGVDYQDLFYYLQEIANDGFWIWYISEDYEYLSPRFKEILGYTDVEMANHPSSWQKIIDKDDLTVLYAKVQKCMKDKEPFYMKVKYQHKDGHNVWVLCRGNVIKTNDKGEAIIMMGTHTDITEMQQLNDQLSIANNVKSKFLALMSHEIRTPLTGILGITEILRNTKDLDKKIYNKINIIHNCGKHLNVILNDVLDYAKLQANKITLTEREFSFADLVGEIVGILRYKIGNKSVKIIKNINLQSDEYIGDNNRIKQIFYNLVSNAIKFTDKGDIIISIKENTNNFIEICIKDSGIGIENDKISSLFQPFTQVIDTKSRFKNQGTGLGLSIVKLLSKSMNGDCWVKSEFGKGCEFYVTLQLQKNKKQSRKQSLGPLFKSKDIQPLKILIVEDNFINRDVIKTILKDHTNHSYDECENGQEALKMFTSNHYDLIIMDAYMPLMNGINCTKAIRELQIGNTIPIIGLTADAFSSNKKECLDAGMNEVLTKPIDFNLFINTINNYSRQMQNHIDNTDLKIYGYNIEKVMSFTSPSKIKIYLDFTEKEIWKLLENIEQTPTYEDIHAVKNLFVSFYPNDNILQQFGEYERERKENEENTVNRSFDFKVFKLFVVEIFETLNHKVRELTPLT